MTLASAWAATSAGGCCASRKADPSAPEVIEASSLYCRGCGSAERRKEHTASQLRYFHYVLRRSRPIFTPLPPTPPPPSAPPWFPLPATTRRHDEERVGAQASLCSPPLLVPSPGRQIPGDERVLLKTPLPSHSISHCGRKAHVRRPVGSRCTEGLRGLVAEQASMQQASNNQAGSKHSALRSVAGVRRACAAWWLSKQACSKQATIRQAASILLFGV